MISHSSEIRSRFITGSVTPVNVSPPEWKLEGRGIFFMGSCFADNLYREYSSSGLNACTSPFGNIYNPESMAEAALMLADPQRRIDAGDCFPAPGSGDDYRHFMFHSRKTAASAEELAESLNREIAGCREYLRTAEAAVMTLGTSLVYRLKSGGTVNNCHKLASSNFDRVQLSPAEASDELSRAAEALRSINPGIRLIVTLSPVRHLRDDAAENSLSKAVLRCAIAEVCGTGEEGAPWYYPSYEIMLDELRDYRWFADDLCHPSKAAVSYITGLFRAAVYTEEYMEFLDELMKTGRDLSHIPSRPDSDEYRSFRKAAESKMDGLRKKYPDFLG